MWRNLLETIGIVFGVFCVILLGVALIIALTYPISSKECHAKWDDNPYIEEVDFRLFGGCMVKYVQPFGPSIWIPASSLRYPR